MKKSGYLQVLMAMAMISEGMAHQSNSGRKFEPDLTPKKKVIPKGCKEFDINGVMIVAMNYKSACKKYNKMPKQSKL